MRASLRYAQAPWPLSLADSIRLIRTAAHSPADKIYLRKPGAGRPPKPARLVFEDIVVQREDPPHRRTKHLCADAGYRGAEHLRTLEDHGHIPHVVDRRKEADVKPEVP